MTNNFEQIPYLYSMEKKIFTKKLGKQIAKVRRAKGLTQVELANLLKKSKQDVHRAESGSVTPTSYFIYRIAKGLKVNINELMDF